MSHTPAVTVPSSWRTRFRRRGDTWQTDFGAFTEIGVPATFDTKLMPDSA